MNIVELQQGTKEWLEWRKSVRTASDAPRMIGVSKYGSRNSLLKEKATGVTPKVNDFQQKIFDEGHRAEERARPLVEKRVGCNLFPIVATSSEFPHIAASFDGVTFDDSIIFEHKALRDSDASRERFELAKKGELLEMDFIQVQQQLLVSKSEKCLFVVSDGTEENMEIAEVMPCKKTQEKIITGWVTFEKDLNEYPAAVEADEEMNALYEKYSAAKAELDEKEKVAKELEKKLKEKAEGTGAKEIQGKGFVIKQQTRKGSIDYATINELKGLDLEAYRKPSTTFAKITAA